jgi:hypothetical protein
MQPLVQMISTVKVPDNTILPLLTFMDMEILHHWLIAPGEAGCGGIPDVSVQGV